MEKIERLKGSFRDPSGFLFTQENVLYRQINQFYKENYDHLMNSGLYDELTREGLLIPHKETDLSCAKSAEAYKIIEPERLPFISYPYEWCFSEYKDAALITLEIQKRALKHGMILKDSSAYNIQFYNGKPILIDTLSFEIYRDGMPWDGYQQFCRHFLAPLALMSKTDIRLSQLMRVYLDGIPLDLTAKLLTKPSRFSLPLQMHIYLHSHNQKKAANQENRKERTVGRVTQSGLLGIIDSLEASIASMKWKNEKSSWSGYYQDDSYDQAGFEHKKKLVEEYARIANPDVIWDLGANTGVFSRIASKGNAFTISWDSDERCVEENYQTVKRNAEKNILPLVMDLTNPSPGLGWGNEERLSFGARGQNGMVMALALVHHLAISNNVPLDKIARFFAQLGEWLVVEWVPKGDPKVKTLLISRKDIFEDYRQDEFERCFLNWFKIRRSEKIINSDRCLYLMHRI